MMTGRFGTVKVYVPSKGDTPDAFLLTGVDAGGEEVYRCLKKMEEAVGLPDPVTGEEAESAADHTWYVVFRKGDNEHAPGPGVLDERGTTFQLDHWPAGTERGARGVLAGRAASSVFSNGPFMSEGADAASAGGAQPSTQGGSQETDAEEKARIERGTKSMMNFVATRFYHGDELAFPAGSECVLHRPDRLRHVHDDLDALTTKADHPVVARRRVWPLGHRDAVYDRAEAAAAEEDLGVPEDEEVGGEVHRQDHEAEWHARPLPDALADRPLWLALLTNAPDHGRRRASATSEGPADPGAGAGSTTSDPAPRLLGVWTVDPSDGRYRYASYPDPSPEPTDETPPEAHGPPTSYVLVPTLAVSKRSYDRTAAQSAPPDSAGAEGQIGLLGHSAWAFASYGPLPHGCLTRAAADLADDPLSTIQFDVDTSRTVAGGARVLNTAESTARWDGEATCWKVYLPDVARITAQMSRVARRAGQRAEEWRGTRPDARLNARLVASACYRPEHGRSYLDEALYTRRRGGEDMEGAWEGFDAPEVKWASLGDLGEGSSELWNVAYGLQRQEAYLAHRTRVAAARLETWLALPAVGVYLRLAAAARASGGEAWPTAAGEVVAEGLGAMCSGGAGGRLMHRLLSEAEVLERTVAASLTGMDQVLDGLEEAGEWPWDGFLGAPTFTALWALTEKGTEGALAVFESFAPAVVTSRTWTRHEKKRVALMVLAEWKLSAPSADGTRRVGEGPGRVERRVNRAYETTVTTRRTAHLSGLQDPQRAPRARIDFEEETATSVRWPGARRNAGIVLSVVDSAVNLAGVATSVRQGEFGLADAAALGDTVVGIAGIYEATAGAGAPTSAGQMLRAARVLGRAAVLVEGATAFAGVVSGVEATTPSGSQRVREVDKGQVVASVVSGVGTVILAGAAGTVTLPVGLVGFGLVAAGTAIGWIDAQRDAERQKEGDPLYKWLPRGSLWGNVAGSVVKTHALMDLARPGWTGGGGTSVSSDEVNDQTQDFVKKAFVFPVGARGRLLHPGPGQGVPTPFGTGTPLSGLGPLRAALPPFGPGGGVTPPSPITKGLVFTIDPWFVPAFGTFVLDAGVRRVSETGAPVGVAVPVDCVVHYVRGDGGFYYRVMPAWEPLSLGPDVRDLLRYAVDERWAWSYTETVDLPDGTTARHAVLRVHVGTGWTPRAYTESERRERDEAQRDAEQGRASSPVGRPDQDRVRAAVVDAAIDTAEGVGALSILPAPPGLAAALGGPSLAVRAASVSGTVSFSPSLPFNPAPTPAQYAPDVLAARERVGGTQRSVAVRFDPER